MSDVVSLLNSLSLEEKVGQLLHIGIPSPTLSQETKAHLKEIKPGGVIYFSRNVEDTTGVRTLSNELQKLSSIPLFISTDQEGGSVMRIAKGVTVFPGNMALGATRSSTLAYQAGKITGEELYQLGINMNLAPVLDVNNNPQNPVIGLRSIGEEPKLVANLGSALALGLQDAQVVATGKHFPGHGDTDQDSHRNLPVVAHNKERLRNVELLPFQDAINKGLRAIMTAHVVFPAFEPDTTVPATLSHHVLTDLLRVELGFEGLILTDCMEMKAIADTFGTVEGAIKTIEAGADMVLISHTPSVQLEAYEALIEAVKSGRISEERLNQSVLRILKAKADFGILQQNWLKESPSPLMAPESLNMATTLARSSQTLVKGEELLPLQGRITIIDLQAQATTIAEDVAVNPTTLGYAAGEAAYSRITLPFSDLDTALKTLDSLDGDIFVVTTMDAHRYPSQLEIIKSLTRKGPVFAVGLRTPYEYRVLAPLVDGYLATYSYRQCSLAAAWEVLTGRINAAGSLPVSCE